MSVWTVEQSGDQLMLGDTMSVTEHREVIRHASAAHDEDRVAEVAAKPVGACWQVDGDGFRLMTIHPIGEALRMAAAGDWRELPAAVLG